MKPIQIPNTHDPMHMILGDSTGKWLRLKNGEAR